MARAGGGLGYRAGLDGLRGIAIGAVLLFHADLPVGSGGFLGVSTFYTLSGFLITSLLRDEAWREGRVDLGRFWQRRARRLLPAALVGLLAVSATAPLFADESQLASLRGDVPWALAYLLNWRLIAEQTSYALLFNAPSPVQHFWSLAIEAQFYVVLPLLLPLLRRLRAPLAGACFFLALAAASAGLSAWLTATGAATDRVYYGSDTRAAEILVGCALAMGMAGRESLRVPGIVSIAAGTATFASWFLVSLDSSWLYRGGLALYAVISAALVVSALRETSLVGRLLRWPPLVVLGRISYGLYVYHWPLYLVLTPERLGLGAGATFAVRVTVAVAVAWASERWLERPLRRGVGLRGRRGAFAALAATALVVAVLLPNTRGADGLSFRDDSPALESRAPTPEGALRYAFFGDSTLLTLKAGLYPWLRSATAWRQAPGVTLAGCGLAAQGRYTMGGEGREVDPVCAYRLQQWREALESGVDLALVLVGPWDVRARQLPGRSTYARLGDPALDAVVKAEIVESVDLLASRGALVVWITAPRFAFVPDKPRRFDQFNEQVDRFNELLVEVQARRPDRMVLIDLASYLAETPERHRDPKLRPDGVHYTRAGARAISAEWLGPRIVEAGKLASGQRAARR